MFSRTILRRLSLVAVPALGAVMSAGQVAHADFMAIDVPTTSATAGFAVPTNSTVILREDFTVNSAISVTNLAALADTADSKPFGTTASPATSSNEVNVYLWATNGLTGASSALTGSALASGTFTSSNSTQIAGSYFFTLNSFTPVTLLPGNYAVIAQMPVSLNYYNTAKVGASLAVSDSSGLISFPADNAGSMNVANNWSFGTTTTSTTQGFTNSTTWTSPSNADYTNLYGAGSFTFVAAPEPASLGFLVIASAAAILRRRGRRQA